MCLSVDFYTSTKSWRNYIFIAICLCVSVCRFLHLHEIVEGLYFHCSLSVCVCVFRFLHLHEIVEELYFHYSLCVFVWTKFKPNEFTSVEQSHKLIILYDLALSFQIKKKTQRSTKADTLENKVDAMEMIFYEPVISWWIIFKVSISCFPEKNRSGLYSIILSTMIFYYCCWSEGRHIGR